MLHLFMSDWSTYNPSTKEAVPKQIYSDVTIKVDTFKILHIEYSVEPRLHCAAAFKSLSFDVYFSGETAF